jgi:hypothetical protein
MSCDALLAATSKAAALSPNREQIVVSRGSVPDDKRTIAPDVTILRDQTWPTVSDSANVTPGMW